MGRAIHIMKGQHCNEQLPVYIKRLGHPSWVLPSVSSGRLVIAGARVDYDAYGCLSQDGDRKEEK